MTLQNYASIDFAKFMAATFVVAIHAQPFCGYSQLFFIDVLARMAVPFFFMASAYFFFRKNPDARQMKGFLKRLGVLYLFWFVVELPITVLHAFIEPDTPFGHNLCLLVRNFFFGSTFGGSWFLMATMQCVWLVWFLSRYLSGRWMMLLSGAVYALAVLSSFYFALLPPSFQSFVLAYRRLIGSMELSWMSAWAPCTIGFLVARYADVLPRILSRRRLYGCMAVCFLLVLAEVFEVHLAHLLRGCVLERTDIYFALLPMVFFLFVYLLQTDLKWHLPYKTLRVYSTLFYFMHFIFVFVLVLVNKHIVPVPPLLKYVIVLCCCAVGSRICLRLSEKKGGKWLKYAY